MLIEIRYGFNEDNYDSRWENFMARIKYFFFGSNYREIIPISTVKSMFSHDAGKTWSVEVDNRTEGSESYIHDNVVSIKWLK